MRAAAASRACAGKVLSSSAILKISGAKASTLALQQWLHPVLQANSTPARCAES
jgi:hypothetical protein